MVDYSSNYFEISQLQDTLSSIVIIHTKQIFSKCDIPKVVISDNDPEFASKEYATFSRQWNLIYRPSSPEHLKSNGLVARTVRTAKRTLRKAFKGGNNPHIALLALRTAAGPNNSSSPASIMFNRQPRTIVPSVMKPRNAIKIKNRQHKNPRPFAREFPTLKEGDDVRFYKDK